MIQNERQYRITRSQAEKFERALDEFARCVDPPADIHPIIWDAQQDAMRNQLDELRAELKQYEMLRSGKQTIIALDSFDDLPRGLIQARIAAGLTQRELADRVGVREQQIQRYEATLYASASLSRVAEVVRALGVSVREEIVVTTDQVPQPD